MALLTLRLLAQGIRPPAAPRLIDSETTLSTAASAGPAAHSPQGLFDDVRTLSSRRLTWRRSNAPTRSPPRRTRARCASRASRTSTIRWPWPRPWPACTWTAPTLVAALLHDVSEDCGVPMTELESRFGREVASLVDGVTKLDKMQFLQRRGRRRTVGAERPGPVGREHAQDVPGHGRGHPRRADQAGRPPAQHADAPVPSAGRSVGASPRRRWRSTRRWPTGSASGSSSGSSKTWPSATSSPRSTTRSPTSSPAGAWRARNTSSASSRCCAASSKTHGIQAELSGRPKHIYSIYRKMQRRGVDVDQIYDQLAVRVLVADHPRLLLGAGRHPLDLAAAAGSVRRLHRQSEGKPVPVAAHDGARGRRPAARDPDPHPRDAPGRRVRRRRALALQGRRASGPEVRRQSRLAAPAHGLAEGRRGRRPGVRRLAQDRHLPGPGLRLHAERRDQGAAERRHAARLRLPHPHRRRAQVRRRQGQRPAGVARYAAAKRRHRRDHHRQGLARAVSRLAEPESRASSTPRTRAKRSASGSAGSSATRTSSAAARWSRRRSSG